MKTVSVSTKAILSVSMLIAMCLSLCAMSAADTSGKPTTPMPSAQVQTTDDRSQTIAALKDEADTIKNFTQNILSTVYFALGAVIVIVFALVGYSWYQNFRVYERDKESMRMAITATLRDESRVHLEQVERGYQERIAAVDKKFSDAIERLLRVSSNSRLQFQTELFRSEHLAKTPRTDLMVLLETIESVMTQAHPDTIAHALGTVIEFVESRGSVDSTTKTRLAHMASQLRPEVSGYGDRLRALLQV